MLNVFLSQCPPYILRQDVSVNLDLPFWIVWLASLLGRFYLYFLIDEITGDCHTHWALMWVLGTQS